MNGIRKKTMLWAVLIIQFIQPVYSRAANPIEILEIFHTQEICNLANGTIQIIVDNPDASTLYSIDNGVTFQSSNFFNNLESGDYLILVINGSGCSETISVQIVDAPEPVVSLSIDCIEGQNLVNIDMTPFPTGIFPFRYKWILPDSSIITSQDITNVQPGQYTVYVTDRLGCAIDSSFYIEPCCELTMSCVSDSIYLDCLSDLPEMPQQLLDEESENRQDSIALEEMGMAVNGMCNEIVGYASEEYVYPTDCSDGDLMVIQTFTADDGVTTVSCERTYFIHNYEAVTLSSPASPLNLLCSDDIEAEIESWLLANGEATFSQCSNPLNHEYFPADVVVNYTCPGNGEAEVNFITTDACNNILEYTSTISVNDNVPPNIECPPNITINAKDETLTDQIQNWLLEVSATDNCSEAITGHDYVDMASIDYCTDTIIPVGFNAFDECQNTSECESTINIIYDFNPEIVCPDNLIIQCTDIDNSILIQNWMDSFEAYSEGNPLDLDITTSIDPFASLSCQDEMILRAELIDPCVQDLGCERYVITTDNEQPDIECPDDLTIDYNDPNIQNAIDAWLSEAAAIDDCMLNTIENNYTPADYSALCFSETIEVIFEASDNCDNSSTCSSNLEIRADEEITFNCPDNLVLNCLTDENHIEIANWLEAFNAFIGTEDIEVVIDTEYDSGYIFSCGDLINISAQVDHICAQEFNCERYISIDDAIAPTIDCPDDLVVDSQDDNNVNAIDQWLLNVAAEDACQMNGVSHNYISEDYSSLCDNLELVVTFQAVDNCDNTSQCQSQLTVIVENEYTIDCPENFIIDCLENDHSLELDNWFDAFTANVNGEATSLELLSDYSQNYVFVCSEELLVTANLDHPCIENLNCERYIIVNDNTAPVIECPSELLISTRESALDQVVSDWLNTIEVQDDCSISSISDNYVDIDFDNLCEDLAQEVTFEAIDNCNNISQCASTIEVQAEFSISINCPDNLIIECSNTVADSDISIWLDQFTGSIDGEALTVDLNSSYQTGMSFSCSEEIEVIAMVEDPCDSDIECTRYIIVNDNTAPEIECPPGITVDPRNEDIDNIINDWLLLASSQDNCGNFNITHNYVSPDLNLICGEETVHVNFSIEDNCQNVNNCESSINMISQFEPSLNCPDNLTIECIDTNTDQSIEEWISIFEAQSNNDAVPITINSNYSQGMVLACGDVLHFECTVDDPCANGMACQRSIEIQDEIRPVINCPEEIVFTTLENDADIKVSEWLELCEATDNCSMVTISHDFNPQSIENLCEVNENIEVTFTSSDACGNMSLCTSYIAVEYIGIELTCPENILVECDDNLDQNILQWISEAESQDLLGNNYNISDDYSFDMIQGKCDDLYHVSFISSDHCGRVSECQSGIIIQDNTAPELICPEAFTIDLNDADVILTFESWRESYDVFDNCHSSMANTTFDISGLEIICEEVFTVEFNAEDECGNTNDCLTELTLLNEGSIETQCPEVLSLIPCFDVDNSSVDAFLNGVLVNSVYDYSIENNFDWSGIDTDCEESFEIEVNFTAVDICGNESQCQSYLEFLPAPKVYIPNIFSPESISGNKWFTAYGNDSVLKIERMLVYDRWGSPVFEKFDFDANIDNEGWDGYRNDILLDSQVFTYHIVVEDIFGDFHEFAGAVQLMR